METKQSAKYLKADHILQVSPGEALCSKALQYLCRKHIDKKITFVIGDCSEMPLFQ